MRASTRTPWAPDRGHEQDGDEVDDAERDHRRDLGQRVHERGRDRDGDGRHHDAEDGRRAHVDVHRAA
jgi:hypothetical protein